MDKVVAAYIAGFLDGEGTITLIKSRRTPYQTKLGKIKRDDYYYLVPRLYIGGNVNRDVLEWCKEKLGAGAVLRKHAQKGNQREYHVLLINRSKKILFILRELLPFLKVKRKHAELMIEFLESRLSRRQKIIQDPKTGKIISFIGKPYTKRELEIYEELRSLNKRGVKS